METEGQGNSGTQDAAKVEQEEMEETSAGG